MFETIAKKWEKSSTSEKVGLVALGGLFLLAGGFAASQPKQGRRGDPGFPDEIYATPEPLLGPNDWHPKPRDGQGKPCLW